MSRLGWLTAEDVLNPLPTDKLLVAVRPKPSEDRAQRGAALEPPMPGIKPGPTFARNKIRGRCNGVL
jgi:hypothetical protein